MTAALTILRPGVIRGRRPANPLAGLAGRLLTMAAFVAAAIGGAGAATAQPADLAARAKAILEATYPAGGPGAAVAITRGGRTPRSPSI